MKDKYKPRDRVAGMGRLIREYKINRRALAEAAGVGYNTVRQLENGANVTVRTFEAIEAALLKQVPDPKRSCKGCRFLDAVDVGEPSEADFCQLRTDLIGGMQCAGTYEPCLAWRACK